MTETRVEYAVRYDPPISGVETTQPYPTRALAKWVAETRGERLRTHTSIVQRTVTVTYGEWEPVQ